MTVYLVGAGPGDPGLITVRGAEVLARADVVIHDRLAAPELLDLVPDHAELISLNESPTGVDAHREEIIRLLVEHGRDGRNIVRLDNGDPFVFAGGGEEAAALIDAGIDLEVVPGVSSAWAGPSAAGIPLTVRGVASSLIVVAGDDETGGDEAVDWGAVAGFGGTAVIVGGVDHWPGIAERLLDAGLSPMTPAAAVRSGTRPEQQTIRATVATLGDHDLRSPSIIVIGAVAAIDVGWLERQPLFGKRIVVTRPPHQAPQLTHELRRRGAESIEMPTIEIVDPDDGGAALRQAAHDVSSYDWVVFTSPNGADRFLGAVRDARAFKNARVAAIGPGTAATLRGHNIVADLVPEQYVAEGLLEVFPDPPSTGGRVLLARAAEARDVLPDGLVAAGWQVDVVPVYRTVPGVADAQIARVGDADVVTFTSSSTVRNFVDLVGAEATPPVVACIGPVTAATARELGLRVDIEAEEHTIAGLVRALERHYRP